MSAPAPAAAAAALLVAVRHAIVFGDRVPLPAVVACTPPGGGDALAAAWAACDDDRDLWELVFAAYEAGLVGREAFRAVAAAWRVAEGECGSGPSPCAHCAVALRRAWQPPSLADVLAAARRA